MQNLRFIKGYRENASYRKSFNDLSEKTFGINFENWYEAGYWTDCYEPYSLVDGETVVANVSVNKLSLIINNEEKVALQIGTVMTLPDYRNKGLSACLMNKVIETFEGHYEIMYLFANQTVLEFYPKFGFKAEDEYQFTMDYTFSGHHQGRIRKLNGAKKQDLSFIYEFAAERIPVSRRFGACAATELLMFYCMYVFSDDIYYLEDEEAIVIYRREGAQLHLFDIISKSRISLERILERVSDNETNEVVFHFTPETVDDIQVKKELQHSSEVLFVKIPGDLELPQHFKHPLTSQA